MHAHLGLLTFWLALNWSIVGQGVEPHAKPHFVLSSFDLGTVPQVKATADELVAELTADEWCTAQPKAAGAWNQVPAGVDPRQWLSVVTLGYGNRADAYALMFDGPQGSARLIAHAPNPKGTLRGIPYWYAPFVKLLNGFRVGYLAPPVAAAPPLLQLEVKEIAAPRATAVAGDKPTLDEARTLDPEKILPPLRALLFTTACAAGWAPTTSAAPSRAVVEVQVLDQACSFNVRFTHEGRESVVAKERISWEEFHDQLTALFRLPLGDKNIHDFIRLGAGQVQLLAAHGDRIAYLIDDELAAFDTTAGREAWRIRIPQSPTARTKKIETYAVRRDEAGGRPRLIRTSNKPAEIAWSDGAVQTLEQLPAESAATAAGLQFVLQPDETLAANNPADGATRWRFAAGDRLLQSPQEFAGGVLVVTKQNRLVLLDAAAGNVTAETTWPTWIVALEIVSFQGRPHLAITDLDGGATLLDEKLQSVWQAKVPSRPTGRPALVAMPASFQKAPAKGGDDLLAAIAADATKPQPFFVLTDVDGFLYRLSLPPAK